MLDNTCQQVVERHLAGVIQTAGLFVFGDVEGANFGLAQLKGLVAGNVLVVGGRKTLLFAGVVGRGADAGQHFRAFQQAIQVVAMAQKVLGKTACGVTTVLGQALLVAEFGGDGLQLFNKGVGRAVAQHADGAVIDHGNRAVQRRIQRP